MYKIKYFIQQSWLLVAASFLFGLLIAMTNAALSQRITENEQNKLYKLMRGLITAANDFEIAIKDAPVIDKKSKVINTDIYSALDDQNQTIGYAFVAVGTGFADKIKLVIAVDNNCEKFFGFKVLASNETPGFGDKIKEDFFSSQFKAAPAEKVELIKFGDDKIIDSRIVAISGATISSTAVINIFNTYIDNVKEQLSVKELIKHGK